MTTGGCLPLPALAVLEMAPPPLPGVMGSAPSAVPFSSLLFTISCLASDVFVPGFVLFIFIFNPLSTVAECSIAILAAVLFDVLGLALVAIAAVALCPLLLPAG